MTESTREVSVIKSELAVNRESLRKARRALRESEHDRDRALRVASRWRGLLRYAWFGLGLGITSLVVGVVTVYIDTVLPLPLGGPITALFVIGGVVTFVLALTVLFVYLCDHEYINVKNNRVGDRHMTRAEYADYKRHQAEEALEELVEVTTQVQELEQELADAACNEEAS